MENSFLSGSPCLSHRPIITKMLRWEGHRGLFLKGPEFKFSLSLTLCFAFKGHGKTRCVICPLLDTPVPSIPRHVVLFPLGTAPSPWPTLGHQYPSSCDIPELCFCPVVPSVPGREVPKKCCMGSLRPSLDTRKWNRYRREVRGSKRLETHHQGCGLGNWKKVAKGTEENL